MFLRSAFALFTAALLSQAVRALSLIHIYGLDAEIIDHRTLERKPLRKDILERLERMAPFFAAHGYDDQLACLRTVCARGNSTQRQRKVFEKRGNIDDVLAHNAKECAAREPIWS